MSKRIPRTHYGRGAVLLGLVLSIALTATAWAVPHARAQTPPPPPGSPAGGLDDILGYIESGWGTLTRSMAECRSVVDPKATGPSILYLPAGFSEPPAVAAMQKSCKVDVQPLPERIEHLGQRGVDNIKPPGLLYLPRPYVVPGGRFNEMYGWDSYFILRGLLRAGKLDLARGMVENFFFEIENYGGFLNANRTYYLTRSQPPFLSSMVMAVYDAEKEQGRNDREWLERAVPYLVKDYSLWTQAPHLAGQTGLSRYYDFGEGPVPESFGAGYYQHVATYFFTHPTAAEGELSTLAETPSGPGLSGPMFAIYLCEAGAKPSGGSPAASEVRTESCDHAENVSLTTDYYKGDRSMRESGFDMAFRFGPYGGRTHHFAAAGLNSLLYKAETDLERIATILGRPDDAGTWRSRAEARRQAVNRYLWNPDRGLYFDYDFDRQAQSSYVFATTFYPLWAGLASPEQARAVEMHLKLLDRPGGLATSTENTGGQWDYPSGWAPLQLIAVEGLRRFGSDNDADRVSTEFLSNVLRNFRRDGTIREKYNVAEQSSDLKVTGGYTENVVGFGWTNAAFIVLLHELPAQVQDKLSASR